MALPSSLLDVLLCLLPVMFISLHVNCKLLSYVACIKSLYYVMRETFLSIQAPSKNMLSTAMVKDEYTC